MNEPLNPRLRNPYPLLHIVLLGLYAALVWLFTSFLTLNQEDWIHFSDFSLEESWSLFLASYNNTNARLGEAGAYFLGPHALSIFHLIQPIFALAACMTSLRLATGQWVARDGKTLSALILLMVGIPAIHAGIWWFIGNLNWFYPATFALLFFALYDNIFSGNFNLPWPKFLFMLPMAFMIGMSNENTSITSVVVYITCGLYWVIIGKKKLNWQYIILGIIMATGAYLLYTAPGPHHRATDMMQWEMNLETLLYQSLLSQSNWLFLFICYWRLLLPAGLLLVFCRVRHIPLMTPRTWILLGAMSIAQGVLFAAPCWGAPRSYTLPQLLFLIILADIFTRAASSGLRRTDILAFFSLFIACAGTMLVTHILKACAQEKITNQIACLAKEAKNKGELHLVLHVSQLDLNPICTQIPLVPRFIMSTDVRPELPLISLSPEKLQLTNTNTQGCFPYATAETFVNFGRRALNIPMAKRFGLESIICIDFPEK